MPPAVVAAGIGGLTQLGGALIGSGAQKNAAKAQGRANQQAMQYQRERDAAADKRYERDYALYQQQLAAREATKRAIAKKYGIELPEWAAAPQAAPAGAPMPGGRPGLTPGNPLPGAPPVTGRPAAAPVPAGGFADLSGAMTQGLAPGGALTGPKPMDDGGGLVGGSLGPEGPAGPRQDPSTWNEWSQYARLR